MKLNSLEELKTVLSSKNKIFLLLYKGSAEQSECAFQRISKIDINPSFKICYADVNLVKDIHSAFGIASVPSLLEFSESKLNNIYKGCQTLEYYKSVLNGTGFSASPPSERKGTKRVTLYTTPTCTWCNTIKTYFKEHHISFTEINLASNPEKAEEMVKKSGQQGVPQTDINGQIVVGFNKNRINELLEIN